MNCSTCKSLNVPDSGTVAWIIHTSVDDAKQRIANATAEECRISLAHMDLGGDSRVTLRKLIERRLRVLSK